MKKITYLILSTFNHLPAKAFASAGQLSTFLSFLLFALFFALFTLTMASPSSAHNFGPVPAGGCPVDHTDNGAGLCWHTGGGGGGSGKIPSISLPAPQPLDKVTSSTGLPAQIVTKFLPAVITILGFLAVFYIVFAGIRFIISKGDPEKVAEARSRLTYAIVGFIILLLAFAATQLIDQLFLNSGAI